MSPDQIGDSNLPLQKMQGLRACEDIEEDMKFGDYPQPPMPENTPAWMPASNKAIHELMNLGSYSWDVRHRG
jgi:hypothetical protein